MNTNLGRTECAVLINKSGASKAFGDVVVVDGANALSFTTTTISGFIHGRIGVILEPNGIANDASGLVAFSGYAPRINLASAASLGDYIKSHTVAGQGAPHATPPESGDFAQALETGTNPSVLLFGSQVQLTTGGGAYFAPSGLTGATQASRYVGATASGAPVTGTFLVGDFVIDQSGLVWICTIAGSPGTWVSPTGGGGGGAMVYLDKKTASASATLDFISKITSTYDVYKFIFDGIIPASSGVKFNMVFSTNNGSSWDTGANYGHEQHRHRAGATASSGSETGASVIDLLGDNISTSSAVHSVNGEITLFHPLSTSLTKIIQGKTRFWNGSNRIGSEIDGEYQVTTAADAVRFLMSSGNIASGTIYMYGIKKS